MRVGGTEVCVPGVQVGVEVEQGHRAVHPMDGAQQRKSDRVVASDREQMTCTRKRFVRGLLDLGDRLGDVERVAGDVAGVGDLLVGERHHVQS